MFSNWAHEAQQRSVFLFLLSDADAIACRTSAGTTAMCWRRASFLSQAGLLEAGKQQPGKLKNQWDWINEGSDDRDNEEILAMLFVLQSKGQFGKFRSVARLDSEPWLKRGYCESVAGEVNCITLWKMSAPGPVQSYSSGTSAESRSCFA